MPRRRCHQERLWCLALAFVMCVGLWAPKAQSGDAAESGTVLCHDRERHLVQRVMPGDCAGRIVTTEEAQKIRNRIQRERAKRFGDFPDPEQDRNENLKLGTGFFVSKSGHIVTARHVIQGCAAIEIQTSDGTAAAAERVAIHRDRDLALLKGPKTSAWIDPWAKREVRAGQQRVQVLGYPMLGVPTTQVRAVSGELLRDGTQQDPGAMVLRADVRPGNSGGPVVSTDGRLIGVIIAKLDTPKYYQESGRLQRHIAAGLRQTVVHRFLQENGVHGGPGGARSTVGSVEDKLRRSVLRVSCRR